MEARSCLAIVLAAGEGTRMRSALPKVLHSIAGRSLLAHVLAAVGEAGVTATAVVVGPGQEAVAAEARRISPGAAMFRAGRAAGNGTCGAGGEIRDRTAAGRYSDRLRRYAASFARRRLSGCGRRLAANAAVAVLGFRPADPAGYGRLIVAGGKLIAIREEADASASERAIDLCNGGIMALAGAQALAILERIGAAQSQGRISI